MATSRQPPIRGKGSGPFIRIVNHEASRESPAASPLKAIEQPKIARKQLVWRLRGSPIWLRRMLRLIVLRDEGKPCPHGGRMSGHREKRGETVCVSPLIFLISISILATLQSHFNS